MVPESGEILPGEEHPLMRWTLVIAVAVALSIALLSVIGAQRPAGNSSAAGLAVGKKAPEIIADGWLNGPAPTESELSGQVLVIDAWASWCGPCRIVAPEIVKLHSRFAHQGVEFMGLTSEDGSSLPDIEEFLRDMGISWRNGYGAGNTLDRFQVIGIPALWVVGRDGTVAWNTDSAESIEDAIEKALAAK